MKRRKKKRDRKRESGGRRAQAGRQPCRQTITQTQGKTNRKKRKCFLPNQPAIVHSDKSIFPSSKGRHAPGGSARHARLSCHNCLALQSSNNAPISTVMYRAHAFDALEDTHRLGSDGLPVCFLDCFTLQQQARGPTFARTEAAVVVCWLLSV